MNNPVLRLCKSSKALVMFATLAVATYLMATKHIEPAQALDTAKWVVAAFLAAVGLEDAAAKNAAGPQQAPEVPPALKMGAASPLPSSNVTIAVVNRSKRVTNDQAQIMTVACATQLMTQIAPVWNRVPPTVAFYDDEVRVPQNAYLVVIVDSPDQSGVLGYHFELSNGSVDGFVFVDPVLDNGGTVLYDSSNPQNPTVSSVLSHELAEAFVDPFVDQWVDGPMIEGGSCYSYEVGDPVEGDSYPIAVQGLLVNVSNFVTPAWFDQRAAKGSQFDWLKKLGAPFTMTPGGYIIIRSSPGTEKNVFGALMPEWKRQVKSLRFGHGGRKVKS